MVSTLYMQQIRLRARRREASVFYGTGRLLERQGDMRGAFAQYVTAIRMAPDFWKTYPALGLFLFRAVAVKLAAGGRAVVDGRQ